MSRFSGKTVVITGASRGIGAALARRFAREGASVVVSANEQAAESVAADIVATGGKAIAQIADVTNQADIVALYDAAEREFGAVDVSNSERRRHHYRPGRSDDRGRMGQGYGG